MTAQTNSSDEAADSIALQDFLDLLGEVHHLLALNLGNFSGPARARFQALYEDIDKLIDEISTALLHDAAVRINKLTEVIKGQTKRLAELKANLEKLQQAAGFAQDLLNAVAQILPHL